MFTHACYHDTVFSPKELKKTVNRTVRKLLKLKKKIKFDAIAFRGVSGSGVAFPVSMLMGMPVIYVRKDKEKTHGEKIEATEHVVKRYIVIDDFISSGDTVREIVAKIDRIIPRMDEPKPVCVGIFLYDAHNGDLTDTLSVETRKETLNLRVYR